jgi:Yip1 domain
MLRIAYAPLVIPTESIRPLQDVWLRPRRVFRELADAPVGLVDQLLGAAQGVVGSLAYCRAQDAGANFSLGQIFGTALAVGSIVGVASLYVMAAIYARIGTRTSKPAPRRQVMHVLAYGGVPLAMSLVIWVLTALLAGGATFMQAPRADIEGFIAILLRVQFVGYVFLMVWSVVLQVMGFSEILGIATRRAFGVWVLGQLIGALAALFLFVLIMTLVPGS